MSSRKLTPFRKKYLKFRIAEQRRKLKLEAIEYKGGKCEKCGYNNCPAALVFHHLDPSQKDFSIAEKGRSHRNLDVIKPELDKCILLCSNCHNELHFAEHVKNREFKLAEINEEKRKFEPSKNLLCACCSEPIKVFNSALKNNNFCSVRCKNTWKSNKGWPLYNEFIELVKTSSPKEIANKFNKALSSTYDRIKIMIPLNGPQKDLIIDLGFHRKTNTVYKLRAKSDGNQVVSKEDFAYLSHYEILKEIKPGVYELTDKGYTLYNSFGK